jgi:hypothetical protein
MWYAWGRGEVFTGFGLGGPKARDHWKDLGVGGSIILRDLGNKVIDGANWIQLALDRVQWGASVNMVMKLRVP